MCDIYKHIMSHKIKRLLQDHERTRNPFQYNAVLQLVAAEKPVIFNAIKYAYQMMFFSTPFTGCSILFSNL